VVSREGFFFSKIFGQRELTKLKTSLAALNPGGTIGFIDQRNVTFRPKEWPTVLVLACIAAIVIAVLGFYLLDKTLQQSADQAFSSNTTVRFPHEEAGHNLVGKDWSSVKEH
jgi:hypothetical protein